MNIRSLMRIAGTDCTEADAERAAVQAQDYILAYCGLCEMSCALERIALTMAAALLRRSGAGGEDAPTGVKSVKVGDTQVEFGAVDADEALAVFRGYDEILRRYRRVRW